MADYALKIAYSRRDDPVRWNIECAKQEAARVRYAAHEVEAQGIDAEGRSRLTLMPSSLGGREGIGKSILECTIAADITRGRLPGCYRGKPRSVIIVATEDSWEHTIVPRLMAADADLERVYLIVAEKSTDNTATAMITLPDDLADVERLIVEKQIVALMLDPLMSRLGRLDSHKDQEVRQALEPLVAMAHRTHCVILGLIHVNKAQRTDPLTSLMASRAFSSVARAVMFVMVDPEDEDTRLLGHPKHNIGPHMPTLKFSIADHRIGKGIQTGRLEWTGESDRSISDALQQHLEQARGNESITATKEVADWLHEYLTKPGGQAPSSEIKKDGEERDYADSTLKRAKNKLGLPLVSNWGCGCGSIRVERRWTCWWSIRGLGRTLISCYGYADDC